MKVWLVEHYVEWGSAKVLGLFEDEYAAVDKAHKEASLCLIRRRGSESRRQVNEETGAVTFKVGDNHFTAMPMDVQ